MSDNKYGNILWKSRFHCKISSKEAVISSATIYTGGIMFERTYSRKCETSDNDHVGPTDGGSHRGQKIKSGIFFKLIIGLGFLAIICTFAIPNPKDHIKRDIQKISSASLDQINATELAIILNNRNTDISNQAEIKEKEIQGKIVEWELEILVVASLPDHYKILTKPTSKYPGTLLTLFPQNRQQMTYINNVKPGTRIKIKGKIAGILQGRIKINPALLM